MNKVSKATNQFEPNGGVYKEHPQAFGGVREICALHRFTDGDVWLVWFNTDNGQWEKLRDATEEDQRFFDLNPFPTTIAEVAQWRKAVRDEHHRSHKRT